MKARMAEGRREYYQKQAREEYFGENFQNFPHDVETVRQMLVALKGDLEGKERILLLEVKDPENDPLDKIINPPKLEWWIRILTLTEGPGLHDISGVVEDAEQTQYEVASNKVFATLDDRFTGHGCLATYMFERFAEGLSLVGRDVHKEGGY